MQSTTRTGFTARRPCNEKQSRHVVVVGVIENVLDFMKEVPPQPTYHVPLERAKSLTELYAAL